MKVSVVVMHGRILQHTRSLGFIMCLHLPHLQHSGTPWCGWSSGSPGPSELLSLRWSKHLANSTPPLSLNSSMSSDCCWWLLRERTSTCTRINNGHCIKAVLYTYHHSFPVRFKHFLDSQRPSCIDFWASSVFARPRFRLTATTRCTVLIYLLARAFMCSLARVLTLTRL